MTNLIHYSNVIDSNEALPLLLVSTVSGTVIPASSDEAHDSVCKAHDSVCKSEVGIVIGSQDHSSLPHSIIRGDNK